MSTIERPERFDPSRMSEDEIEMARAANQCIMNALDYSSASQIVLTTEDGSHPQVSLPPQALKYIGELLRLMSAREPLVIMPAQHELSTIEAANYLNVSRPFVIKAMESGQLPFRKVGTHRRVSFEDLEIYARSMRQDREAALERMADEAREFGLDD